MNRQRTRSQRGFSMIELLIVVASIGIVSTVAVAWVGEIRSSTERSKLDSDVATINSALNVYLANGGDLAEVTDPQTILNHLKSGFSDSERDRIAGVTGSTIDKRLAVDFGEVVEGKPLVRWNSTDQRFEISEEGGSGIVGFILDDALSEVDYSTGTREASALVYNDRPGWVWAHTEVAVPQPAGPTTIPVSDTPDTLPRPPPLQLSPPIISVPSGTFDEDDFPFSVSLSNPNNPATWIMYSVSGGAFQRYGGGSISITESTTIVAYADGDPNSWIQSRKEYATYYETPPPPPQLLTPPTISLTSGFFTDDITEIGISLTNPNAVGSSNLYYSVVAPDGTHPDRSLWTQYLGPVATTSTDFPEGYVVAAYARSVERSEYIDSSNSFALVGIQFFEIPITGNVLFIVDASGSMERDFGSSTRFGVTIKKLKEVIDSLPSNLRFNVATFAGGIHWTDGSFELKQANNPNKNALLAEIDALEPDGRGTSYLAALSLPEMFSPLPEQVIILSDGQPQDSGYLDEVAQLAARGVRIDTIGLDFDSEDSNPLADIAALAGGNFVTIGN